MKKFLGRLTAAILSLSLLVTSVSALTVEQALRVLEDMYVEEIPSEAYSAESLEALFQTLGDPYTGYYTAEEYQAYLALLEGAESVVGIGVYISLTGEGLLIQDVIDGGSAKEMGLTGGDLIIAIDGISCVPAHEAHQQMLLGTEGTYVTVTVRRGNGNVETFFLERRLIETSNTTVEVLEGHIGYIDCDSFGLNTGRYFIEGIQRENPRTDVWVVDLRNNGGGYTQAAAEGIGAFSGADNHLFFRGRDGVIYGVSTAEAAVTNQRAVVLVNGNSASSSEILAGGLRDEIGAVTVGSRTFGKGIAQALVDETVYREYFDGDAMKVTNYRFYTYLGNTTDKIGVIPTLLTGDYAAEPVAVALCDAPVDQAVDGCLRLELRGDMYYMDVALWKNWVLQTLLESLPPDVPLWLGENGVWVETTVDGLAARYGLVLDSRWFDDVGDSPYADAINALGTYDILRGLTGDSYGPYKQLTRAQMCAMLYQALGSPAAPVLDQYSDVPAGAWYADAVNTMTSIGVVEGDGEKFDPNGALTQEQFITIMGRLCKFLNCFVNHYAEKELDLAAAAAREPNLTRYREWAREGVMVLTQSAYEVFTEGDNMLYTDLAAIDPAAPVTREQAAATLYNILTTLYILAY